jgi:hypothetical protein
VPKPKYNLDPDLPPLTTGQGLAGLGKGVDVNVHDHVNGHVNEHIEKDRPYTIRLDKDLIQAFEAKLAQTGEKKKPVLTRLIMAWLVGDGAE